MGLGGCKGGSAGSYSDSPGVEIIRRHVAEYIEKRDGGIPSDWQNVILCAGASEGIRAVMKLLTNPNGGDGEKRPGVMIPIPQYPLYSASLAEYNMSQVNFFILDLNLFKYIVSPAIRSVVTFWLFFLNCVTFTY